MAMKSLNRGKVHAASPAWRCRRPRGGATPHQQLIAKTHRVRAPRNAANARIMMSSGQHLGEMEGLSNLVMEGPGAGVPTTHRVVMMGRLITPTSARMPAARPTTLSLKAL